MKFVRKQIELENIILINVIWIYINIFYMFFLYICRFQFSIFIFACLCESVVVGVDRGYESRKGRKRCFKGVDEEGNREQNDDGVVGGRGGGVGGRSWGV